MPFMIRARSTSTSTRPSTRPSEHSSTRPSIRRSIRRSTRPSPRRLTAIALAGVLALLLTACVESQREQPGGDEAGAGGPGQPATAGDTLIFGTAGAPKLFDPFYTVDGETTRITRQIFDNLVGFVPGTADVRPELATDWSASPDGRAWTFNLRSGVRFHDGTTFDAEAVCANFDRWYNQTGAGQNPALSYYWIQNFGGFADRAQPSLFESCHVQDDDTVIVRLTRATGKFPALLGVPSFAIQSPTAMERHRANDVAVQGDSFTFPPYALEHPTGTGPFTFAGFDPASGTVTLRRSTDYWDEPAKLDRLIFRVIPDETARRQALEAGEIDGYDLPNPADWQALRDNGYTLLVREPFNILYVGITQKNNSALRHLRVRQALAHAINRDVLVSSSLPAGAEVARGFYPPSVDGWVDDSQQYPYDPQRARELLAEAGAADLTVNFYWPTEVTRPYLPDPRSVFGVLRQDLEAAGITVNVISKPWNGGYLDDVENARADLFLLGWTGDYNSPDHFLSALFGSTRNRFWLEAAPWGEQLVAALREADAEPDPEVRLALYQDLNRRLMADYLPAIPVSHSPAAIVVSPDVTGLVPSPLTGEKFAPVAINGG